MQLPIEKLRESKEKDTDKLSIGKFISGLIEEKWDKFDRTAKVRVDLFDKAILGIAGFKRNHWESVCHETGWHIRIRQIGNGRSNYYVFSERKK